MTSVRTETKMTVEDLSAENAMPVPYLARESLVKDAADFAEWFSVTEAECLEYHDLIRELRRISEARHIPYSVFEAVRRSRGLFWLYLLNYGPTGECLIEGLWEGDDRHYQIIRWGEDLMTYQRIAIEIRKMADARRIRARFWDFCEAVILKTLMLTAAIACLAALLAILGLAGKLQALVSILLPHK